MNVRGAIVQESAVLSRQDWADVLVAMAYAETLASPEHKAVLQRIAADIASQVRHGL